MYHISSINSQAIHPAPTKTTIIMDFGHTSMTDTDRLEHLKLLASSRRPFRITFEADYGLIVESLPDGSLNVKLNSSLVAVKPPAEQEKSSESDGKPTPSGYKYRIFPDWGTNHLFYDSSWPSNPPDALNCEEEEILQDHKGKTDEAALKLWLEAFNAWGKRYDDAFDTEVNATGDFSREEFPDIEARKAWTLEGMMLAVWLALLPGVDGVEYSPHSKTVVFSASGHGESSLNDTVQSFLKDLDTHLTSG